MNIKEIVSKIKVFLAEVEFTDVKTNDGTIISFDKELAVGGELFVVDESGRTPAPDGEYYLEDGTKIVVVNGLIDTIVQEAETPEEEVAPEEMPEGMADPIPAADGTGPHGMPWMPENSGDTSGSTMMTRIEQLEASNLEMKKILSLLAETLSKKAFEEDVKMSIIPKEEIKQIQGNDFKPKLKNNYNELDTIFKNMYKNRKK